MLGQVRLQSRALETHGDEVSANAIDQSDVPLVFSDRTADGA